MKTVNILGTTYRIKIKKLGGLHGECWPDKKLIKIDASKGTFAETLIHEVLHAALFEAGLTHLLNTPEGLEEAVVRAIEHGLKTAGLIPPVSPNNKPPLRVFWEE